MEAVNIFVKITLYKDTQADRVIYYRNEITVNMSTKWRWYFDYLAALVKVSNPRQKVTLDIGIQKMLQGKKYIESKTKTLLSAKKGQLKKLEKTGYIDDIFDFETEKREDKIEKIEKIKMEIEALERGEFNYYVPPVYINEIKNHIKKFNNT